MPALVQKSMIDGVDPVVNVYAPAGPDLDRHLALIEGFNTRAENPTHWVTKVHASPDYLAEMLREKPGNVVVISGNNGKKARYILECVKAGPERDGGQADGDRSRGVRPDRGGLQGGGGEEARCCSTS